MRRLKGLPRGAWGSSLAHLGLGLFVLGACFEGAFKAEAAAELAEGGRMPLGAYTLTLESVAPVNGPNYDAERGVVRLSKGGQPVCSPSPERRVYLANGQNTSEVAICQRGLDDLYVVLGERRTSAGGAVWVVRAYDLPWARLIFFGPIFMALGGLISLSDRRLRLGAPARVAAPALEPAE